MSELDLRTAACLYADRGWQVLPLYSIENGECTCRKGDRCGRSAGKHPACRRGVNEATTETSVIRAWWDRLPNANIGIATGEASGIAVLDIDPRNGGDASLQRLEAKYGLLPRTILSWTGGGGLHIIFRHHPAVTKSSTERIAPGIDLKTSGGYFVAPPSLHLAGTRYQWDGGALSTDGPIPEFPDWLLRLLVGKSQATRNRECIVEAHQNSTARDREVISEGKRNSSLARYGGLFRRFGLEFGEINAALQRINEQRCIPPLDRWEVQRIAQSMERYPVERAIDGFVPNGYDCAHSALLAVIRFAVDLPRSEFLMLLFHVERSLGYGKTSDCTSISQMLCGIRSNTNGTWVRRGCGLQKSTIIKANRALIERGVLLRRHRSSPERGKEPTKFEVDWKVLCAYIAGLKIPPDDEPYCGEQN